MQLLISIFVFVLGAIVGSFLNVVIARWNTGISLGGRSFCFSCGKTLSPRELVPIASFLFQGGRCRKCRTKISLQYPAVEFLTGALFLSIFLRGLPLAALVFYVVAFSLAMVISVYDIKHTIIPDELVYTFIGLAFIGLAFAPAFGGSATLLDLLAGPLLAMPFAALWLISGGRWMGLGDAKLMFGIGWLLGFDGGLLAFMLAFWLGALGGILVLLWGDKRFKMQSEIPFGPFLVAAAFIVFVFGLSFSSLQLAVGSLFFF